MRMSADFHMPRFEDEFGALSGACRSRGSAPPTNLCCASMGWRPTVLIVFRAMIRAASVVDPIVAGVEQARMRLPLSVGDSLAACGRRARARQ